MSCDHTEVQKRVRFSVSLIVAAAILLLGHPKPVAAQGETSTLIGMVQDSAGQPIAGAQLYVLGTKYVGLSDSSGHFEITGRPSGALALRAKAALGFRPHDEPVEVEADRTMRVTIGLASVGGCLKLECKGVRVVPTHPDSIDD